MNKTALLILALVSLTLAGCASVDRATLTRFEPIQTQDGSRVYKFTAFADAVYPLASDDAERIRIGWLEQWLSDNGHDAKHYKVISRVPVLRNKGLMGDIYDIYYQVSVTSDK